MSVELMSVAQSYVPKWPKSPDFIIINPPKTQQKLNNDNVLEYELGTIIVNFGVLWWKSGNFGHYGRHFDTKILKGNILTLRFLLKHLF